MMKTSIEYKNKELVEIINTHFEEKVNLARVKLIALMVVSFCKVQKLDILSEYEIILKSN